MFFRDVEIAELELNVPETFQRITAALILVASAPLLLLLVLLVRLDTPGPPLYRATRVGEGGRRFTCVKLRTMRADAGHSGPAITRADDDRVTRMGRMLRGSRLDELPQLWNVVRGEMNLVGPRPEDPRFVNLSDPLHREVFTARPGITGLAQVVFADEASMVQPGGHELNGEDVEGAYAAWILPSKLLLDRAYLDARSIGLDLRILWWTGKTVLGRPPTAGAVSRIVGNDAWRATLGDRAGQSRPGGVSRL